MSIHINSSIPEATSVQLTWSNAQGGIDTYRVSCSVQQRNKTLLEIVNHTISVDVSSNMTSATIRGLLPESTYSCCVSDFNTSNCVQVTSQPGNDMISPAVAGVVGAIIGMVFTLIIVTAIIALTTGAIFFVRRTRWDIKKLITLCGKPL